MSARAKSRQPRRDAEWEIYALAAAPLAQRLRINRRSLRVFRVGPVAVIAGSPRREPLSTEDALREQHAIVMALADRVDPLLPARFGSRMTAVTLDATIRPAVDVVMEALRHVKGRRQMTVRLIGASEHGRPLAPSTTGTAYLTQRRAAAHEVPVEAVPLLSAVRPFVTDQRVQPGRGRIRTTLFHLVGRQDVARYRARAEAVVAEIRPWTAVISGPWPAFAFVPELTG